MTDENNIELASGSGGETVASDFDKDDAQYVKLKLFDATATDETGVEVDNGTAAESLRVTVAEDSTGQVKLAAGTATVGEVTIGSANPGSDHLAKRSDDPHNNNDTGIAGLAVRKDTPADLGADGDYSPAQVSAGRAWLNIQGDAAHDSAVSGSPVLGATKAVEMDGTAPSEVAEGDAVRVKGDLNGRMLANEAHPALFNANDNQSTAQTNKQLRGAPTDGSSIYVTDVFLSNGATAGNIKIVEDTAGTPANLIEPVYLPINGHKHIQFESPLRLTADKDLGYTSTTSTTHSVAVQGWGGAAAAYNPGMMTFDGSTGYYDKSGFSVSGNKVTAVCRFKHASFSGGGSKIIADLNTTSNYARLVMNLRSNDIAQTEQQDRLAIYVLDSTGGTACYRMTDVDVCDGADHTVFFSYDGDAGTVIFYCDGVDCDDATFSAKVLTTATLSTSSPTLHVGNNHSISAPSFIDGELGYFGYRDAYLTNPTDFYHPTNGLQELDESGWTEWGAQPLFWNQYGTMTDNKGSAGNMTKNGTITGPA